MAVHVARITRTALGVGELQPLRRETANPSLRHADELLTIPSHELVTAGQPGREGVGMHRQALEEHAFDGTRGTGDAIGLRRTRCAHPPPSAMITAAETPAPMTTPATTATITVRRPLPGISSASSMGVALSVTCD